MPPQLLALRKSTRSLLVIVAAIFLVAGNLMSAQAASLNDSSLTLSDPRPSETGVTYTFAADGFSGSAQCIDLEIDTQADGAGGVPSGFDSTGANLDASGTMITEASWTEDFTTNGLLRLTFVTGETPSGPGTLVFTGVDNGDTEDTYYGVFTTYSDACTTPLDTVVIAFAYTDGALVTLTIDPALTFTVSGVTTGQSINGSDNTTIVSTGTAIDFANAVTSSANGVSAHELDVTTNASGGYVVYLRHTGDLVNTSSDTITVHTGTNGTPSSFPAAGTEAWGYTTDDSTLTGGTADRFTTAGGDLWAGFTTSNAPVMDNPSATAGTDTNSVAHQVGISTSTEAGDYQTTIIYTIVATY
ncbi:MAG TPA: hypothetical protein VF996_01345 [Candidatus Saccharimonadales bacterium]|jgi:hypothetical protein